MFSGSAPTLIYRIVSYLILIHPLSGLAPVHRHSGSEVLVDLEGLPHEARSCFEMLPVIEDIVICHDDRLSSYLKRNIVLVQLIINIVNLKINRQNDQNQFKNVVF